MTSAPTGHRSLCCALPGEVPTCWPMLCLALSAREGCGCGCSEEPKPPACPLTPLCLAQQSLPVPHLEGGRRKGWQARETVEVIVLVMHRWKYIWGGTCVVIVNGDSDPADWTSVPFLSALCPSVCSVLGPCSPLCLPHGASGDSTGLAVLMGLLCTLQDTHPSQSDY